MGEGCVIYRKAVGSVRWREEEGKEERMMRRRMEGAVVLISFIPGVQLGRVFTTARRAAERVSRPDRGEMAPFRADLRARAHNTRRRRFWRMSERVGGLR